MVRIFLVLLVMASLVCMGVVATREPDLVNVVLGAAVLFGCVGISSTVKWKSNRQKHGK